MKAEEYLKQYELICVDFGEEKAIYKKDGKQYTTEEIMEAYHQSKVNAVSEEKLLDTYIRKEMTQDECSGFSDGMEEFKKQLLKQ